MGDVTVVYFTSNRERPAFEEKIRATLLNTIGDLPLISVSQKPIDFGINICVGEHEPSTHNALRQLQAGAKMAKTDFVSLAESDFLYPKEYFQFTPEDKGMAYLAHPVYVLFAQRGKARVFAQKRGNCDSAIVVGRDTLINGIDVALNGRGQWSAEPIIFKSVLDTMKQQRFTLPIPAVTFKTDNNMHRKTPHSRDSSCRELDGWGKSADLIRNYLG